MYPGATTRSGHAGLRETFSSWGEAWGELTVELDDVVELDDEQVLAVGRQHARSGAGGVELEAQVAGLYRLRDGLIVTIRFFLDADQARAAAAADA